MRPCSDCRQIHFGYNYIFGYLQQSVSTVICKWSGRTFCIQTWPLCTNLSAWAKWKRICRDPIWIAFANHLAMCFGSDLQKSDFMWLLLLRLNKINLDTIWTCQKSDLGCQSEQGLSWVGWWWSNTWVRQLSSRTPVFETTLRLTFSI